MATTRSEFVIESSGNITRRDIAETHIAIADELISSLTDKQIIKVKGIMDIPGYGIVDMSMQGNTFYYSMPIKKLTVRTDYKMLDGIFVPSLGERGQTLTMTWKLLDRMTGKLMVSMNKDENCVVIHKMWMPIYDDKGRIYRIPIPNLYGDTEVCHGNQHLVSESHQRLLLESIKVFENSEWNTDLIEARSAQIQSFFKFKPTNEGFDQIPPAGKWEEYCQKVAPKITDYLV
jgi:hypothetical protein